MLARYWNLLLNDRPADRRAVLALRGLMLLASVVSITITSMFALVALSGMGPAVAVTAGLAAVLNTAMYVLWMWWAIHVSSEPTSSVTAR